MRLLKKKEATTNILIYFFGFLLLWEWLRPLKLLTDTGYISVFLLFIFVSLLLSYLRWHFVITFSIKFIFILSSLHFFYFEGSVIQFGWLSILFQEIKINLGYVLDTEWTSLSDIFRTLLFFILLWLLTYLIHYWIVIRKQMFLFFLMTLIYITVLDTFTLYEADVAIVRTVIVGFVVMGMLNFYRLINKEAVPLNLTMSRKWMTPLVIMIAICVAVGFAAPKYDPIWPDPVPFIKSLNKDSGVGIGGVQKVGYGSDDSNLGGPFIGDDQVVMKVESDSRHYWKIESKSIYTGKGWITVNNEDEEVQLTPNENIPIDVFNTTGVEITKEVSLVTTALHKQSFIAYPLGINKIISDAADTFRLDPLTEKINSYKGNSSTSLSSYAVEFDSPKYSMKALSEAFDEQSFKKGELYQRYTQIPSNLPHRIRELALDITSEDKTWFDKAKAVESYFRNNGYIYDQKDVAIPAEDQDYVDQFLFETKQGYCDNFSTSMAILLRTIGIPTRWVKGYTEGEYQGVGATKRNLFEITNNNAHSWVEVYFPQVGWVPFEPTQGFSNSVAYNYDLESEASSQIETEEEEKKTEVEKPEKQEKDLLEENQGFSFFSFWETIKSFFVEHLRLMIVIMTILALVILKIYHNRQKWIPYVLIIWFKRKNKDSDFVRAYLSLLRQLNRYGFKRKPGQTLRDYANYIDHYYSNKEMGRLTSQYEKYLYKGYVSEGTWNELKELWENLIKRTKG